MEKLTEMQSGMLDFADVYGPGIDFGGRGGKSAQAKILIAAGLLSGEVRNCTITDAGRAALTAALSQEVGK